MNRTLEGYITTLERLAQAANGSDKEALNYAIANLRNELYRASLEMMSS